MTTGPQPKLSCLGALLAGTGGAGLAGLAVAGLFLSTVDLAQMLMEGT